MKGLKFRGIRASKRIFRIPASTCGKVEKSRLGRKIEGFIGISISYYEVGE